MQAEIICIGTELTKGQIINTNAGYLSKQLAGLGIDVFYHTTVDDNSLRLFTMLKRALRRSQIVITTGGLGPTVDDITMEIIAQTLQKRLILNHQLFRKIKYHFSKRRLPMPKDNLRQALIPEGAKLIKNESGTAAGIIIEQDKKVLIALPGVPQELIPMVEQQVIAYLRRHSPSEWVMLSRRIRITGLSESAVNQRVKDILQSKPPITVGIYAHIASIDLEITAKAKQKPQAVKLINNLEKKIQSRLKGYIFGQDNQTLEEVVARSLTKKKKTIALAESCTGGLLAQRLTNVSGSSRYFPLGLVVYSNQAKQSLLGIPAETLKKFGAVSKQTALLMAKNVRQLAKTDLGLGISGIAGPTAAATDKPVGLVYIALVSLRKSQIQQCYFHGDRQAIRQRAAQTALDIVRKHLNRS